MTTQTSTLFKSLSIEIADGIAEVSLKGPGKGNAMGPDFWSEMPNAFKSLDEDEKVRVVLIKGEGANFSVGLDLVAMLSLPELEMRKPQAAAERTKLYDFILRMQPAITSVARCRKPVIASVDGYCIGAGLDLISACDIRVCSEQAKFSLREVKVAIVADMGSLQRLPFIIGEAHTRDLALTGRDITAQEALRINLVSQVFASAEALKGSSLDLAKLIAANPPLVVQGIKRVMNEAREKQVEEGLRISALWNSAFLQSGDFLEAIKAFQEKRSPNFTGN